MNQNEAAIVHDFCRNLSGFTFTQEEADAIKEYIQGAVHGGMKRPVPGEAALLYQRVPSYDKPCDGGNHFTLGYRNDALNVVYICPNAECGFFTRTLEAGTYKDRFGDIRWVGTGEPVKPSAPATEPDKWNDAKPCGLSGNWCFVHHCYPNTCKIMGLGEYTKPPADKCLATSKYGCICLLDAGHEGKHDSKCGWNHNKWEDASDLSRNQSIEES